MNAHNSLGWLNLSFLSAAMLVPFLFSGVAVAEPVSNPSGLRYVDEVVGTGTEAVKGKQVTVNYTGWILEAGDKKGTKFDSSLDRKQPFSFVLGQGMVIRGWDEGVAGMKVGGKRTLMIPSHLGYGVRGAGGVIPPNANLVFEVELLKVE